MDIFAVSLTSTVRRRFCHPLLVISHYQVVLHVIIKLVRLATALRLLMFGGIEAFLESESCGHLEPPGLLGGDGLAEKRGTKNPNITRVVHVIQDVEGIQPKSDRRAFVF